ncbi:MAG: GspMb/PilO family protein [Acidobacteriota bacterium]|jgi:Tfp pilus assembly protein PilO|nr:MAG: hypothetical protein DIU54_06845 [Acidobacteriota bacterium]
MSLWRRIYDERRSVLLPLFAAALANLLVLIFVVMPLRRSVASSEESAQQAAIGLVAARQALNRAHDAAASRERADEQLQQFYSTVLPSGFPEATRATNRWLQDAARAAGLEYVGSSFAWEPVRDSVLSRASSDVTLRGTYGNIRRFLADVEAADLFLVVEQLQLRQSSASRAAGTLDVGLVVSTYFLTESPRP